MRVQLAALAVTVAILAGGASAAAQQQCELTSGANARLNQVNPGTPQSMIFIGGLAQFNCPDGKVIRSDSAIIVDATQQRYLIGHAYYSDADKTLTSERMTFFGKEGRLTAEQNVVVTNKANGSVIRGEFLNYTQAAGNQPSRAIVYGGRPHAVLHGKSGGAARDTLTRPDSTLAGGRDSAAVARAAAGDSAGRIARDSTAADTTTTVVDADQMQLVGQDEFHGSGNVQLARGDVRGTGQQVAFTQSTGQMQLVGNAHMEGSNFTLDGGTIDGVMKNNALESVHAVFRARLVADDVHVNAPSIAVSFRDGKVQQLIALSAKLAKRTETDGDAMAEALARDFRLVADSIEALVPDQQMERIIAVGGAYGERTNDSIKAKLPKVASNDWLRGDTIIGVFARPGKPLAAEDSAFVVVATDSVAGDSIAEADTAAAAGKADTADVARAPGSVKQKGQKVAKTAPTPSGSAADTAQSELRAVVAVGTASPASSIYRVLDKKKPGASPAINYLLANRITLAFHDGDVSKVKADGAIRGLHLQPQSAPTDSAKAAADSAKAAVDSAKARVKAPADTTKVRARRPGSGKTESHGGVAGPGSAREGRQ